MAQSGSGVELFKRIDDAVRSTAHEWTDTCAARVSVADLDTHGCVFFNSRPRERIESVHPLPVDPSPAPSPLSVAQALMLVASAATQDKL
jgi:hypothetical protein